MSIAPDVHPWRPSSRLLAIFAVVELPFSFLALIGWAALLGLEPGAIAGVVAVTSGLRWLLVYAAWRRLLAPVDRWQRADSPDVSVLRDADGALARAPTRFALLFPAVWVGSYAVVTAWMWFQQPDSAPLGPEDLVTAAGFASGTRTSGSRPRRRTRSASSASARAETVSARERNMSW